MKTINNPEDIIWGGVEAGDTNRIIRIKNPAVDLGGQGPPGTMNDYCVMESSREVPSNVSVEVLSHHGGPKGASSKGN